MKKQKGFTLIELLVVISVIAMLLSIIMPSLAKARYMAKRSVCMTNIRSQLVIQRLYTADNDGKYHCHDDYSPEYMRSNWADDNLFSAIQGYVEDFSVMNCPILRMQSKSNSSFEMFSPDYYKVGFGGNWEAFSGREEMLEKLPSIFGGYMWLANYRCTWPSGRATEPIFKFVLSVSGTKINVNETPWPKAETDATSRTALIVHRISDTHGYFFDYSHKGAGYSPAPNGFVDFATCVDNPIGCGDGSVVVRLKSNMQPRAYTTAGVIYY
jgi:prepilin-type N-terminal cleavage/methylation domain-containing protein